MSICCVCTGTLFADKWAPNPIPELAYNYILDDKHNYRLGTTEQQRIFLRPCALGTDAARNHIRRQKPSSLTPQRQNISQLDLILPTPASHALLHCRSHSDIPAPNAPVKFSRTNSLDPRLVE